MIQAQISVIADLSQGYKKYYTKEKNFFKVYRTIMFMRPNPEVLQENIEQICIYTCSINK